MSWSKMLGGETSKVQGQNVLGVKCLDPKSKGAKSPAKISGDKTSRNVQVQKVHGETPWARNVQVQKVKGGGRGCETVLV